METNKKIKEIECPLCGEYLELHKKGVMENSKTGEFIYTMTCEQCNQAFGLDDETPKLISYDASMKPIKNECKVCKVIKNYNEHGLSFLNVDTAFYEFHCFDCAKPILQDWADLNLAKKTKIDNKNINEISEMYDFQKNNEMMIELNKNPDKYKETMKKMEKEFEAIDNDLVAHKSAPKEGKDE